MNMHWLDWGILAATFGIVLLAAIRTKRYTKSVADFLVANRCAGKYLLGVAAGAAGLGAITIIAMFEAYYKAGFTFIWWQTIFMAVVIIIALTGWIQYRYRQTRVLTMSQFFEIRYSRRFRIFAGFLAFGSGILNFGIFPAIGSRFFQHFCGLPVWPVSIGFTEIDLTYAIIMAILLLISLYFTFLGGQITVMVTDFLQGILVDVAFVIIGIYLLFYYLDWSQITEAMATAPPNASLVNPLKTSQIDNFNLWYILIGAFGMFLNFMAWQGNQGYSAAAKTPHEARMGRVLGFYRQMTAQKLVLVLVPIVAYTVLHHEDFSAAATSALRSLDQINSDQLRDQLRVSIVLTKVLPLGLMGLFAAVMFAAFVSTHDTYLHSWGSIFIQDVMLPIRQIVRRDDKPISPKSHIWLLRLSIIGVAIFIFLFSLFFNLQQDILMFFALTGSFFLGWAGVTIVGGLYWKYGTKQGAWVAALVGLALALCAWYLTYCWGHCQSMLESVMPDRWHAALRRWPELAGRKFPINAQILWFWSMVCTGAVYVVVSLISGRGRAFNMDRMLHRGKYADCDTAPETAVDEAPRIGRRLFKFSKEFSLGDKCIFAGSYLYIALFCLVFLFGTIYAIKYKPSDASWENFWWGFVLFMLGLGTFVTVWLAIGGFRDLGMMYKLLRSTKRNIYDDGTVVGEQSLADLRSSENNDSDSAKTIGVVEENEQGRVS